MKNINLLIILSLFSCSHICLGQQWKVDKVEIPEPQFATENRFGYAMAADNSGDIVVAGAPKEDAGQLNSGAVYIYQRVHDSYELIKKITPSDPSEDKQFGFSVAINDSIIAIGAPYDRTDVWGGGAVYLFKRGKTGWKDAYQIKRIVSDSLAQYGSFGFAVAIKQNTIVVGSPGATGQAKYSGVAYIYEKGRNWKDVTLKGRLMASEHNCLNGCSTRFGHSVAIGNNYIAVGAPYHDKNAYDDGAVFIFDNPKDGWQDAFESTTLHLKGEVDNAEIGKGLAIHKDMLITGARGPYRGRGQGQGYAYLFQKDETGWKSVHPVAALKADEGAFINNTYAVSLRDDYAILGAPMNYRDTTGGIYIFHKPATGWADATEDIRIAPEDLAESHFGLSVLPLHDRLLIGAPLDNRPALASGSIFELVRENQDWQVQHLTRWDTPREEDASEYIFGDDVAIYENTMVVGAPRDNLYGAAYVYVKENGQWMKVAKLTASDRRKKDNFGAAVNIFKDDIIVGAPYADDERKLDVGAAYVFTKPEAGWQDMHETAKFIPSDTDGYFGYSVDLNQDFAAVGINPSSSQEGGVYIFEKSDNSWVSGMETIHIPPQATNGDLLGNQVDCNSTGVLASAPLKNKVYLFEKKNGKWNLDNPTVFELSKLGLGYFLTKSFHLSVSLSKNYAVIGWPYATRDEVWGAGKVFVFRRVGDTWRQEPDVLEAPLLKASEFFGADVDIDDDLLVVGANGGYSNMAEQRQPGAAYVYARNGKKWQLVHQVSAMQPTDGDLFGMSVGIVGTGFVVGAPHDVNEAGFRSGSAYIFNHYGPWIEQVSSIQPDGWYGIGQEVPIDVYYDDTVWVQGNSTLNLRLDTMTYKVSYDRGSGSKKITFRYEVGEGHTSSDLAYNNVFSLSGELYGREAVKANMLLPHPGRLNSLKGSKDIKIDGIRPILKDSLTVRDTTNQSEVAVYWTSSELVHQVDSSFIKVYNGELLSWDLLDSLTLVAHIQPDLGKVEVNLLQGAVRDQAMNSALSITSTFWYDSIPPNLTVEGAYVRDTTVLEMRLGFSEKVSGFSTENIILENGELQAIQQENDSSYVLEIHSPNPETLIIDLNPTSIADKAGNKLRKDKAWPVKGGHFLYPAPPSHLQAIVDSIGHAILTWQDSSAKEFVLHRAVTADFAGYDSMIVATHEIQYKDTTLLNRPESKFYFRIAGVNYGRQSAFSNTAEVDYSLYPPQQLTFSLDSNRKLHLSWKDFSKAEEGFIIERALSEAFHHADRYTVPADINYFVDTVMNDTVQCYWYRVRAYHEHGVSAPSSTITVYPALAPPILQNVHLQENGHIEVVWQNKARNASGCRIERSLTSTFDSLMSWQVAASESRWIDTTVLEPTRYYYRIVAYNDFHESQSSSSVMLNTSVTAPPDFLAEVTEDNSVHLRWTDEADNELGYFIERSASKQFEHNFIIYLPENTEEYVDHNVIFNSNIYYRIAAYNAIDTSEVLVITVDFLTAIPSTQESTFMIYPNPANDRVQVFINNAYRGSINYQILSVNGDLIFSDKFFKAQQEVVFAPDVSNLPEGVYWLRMVCQDEAAMLKLIKM